MLAPTTPPECQKGRGGYAARMLVVVQLSITTGVLFTACLVLAVLAGASIFLLVRGKRGE